MRPREVALSRRCSMRVRAPRRRGLGIRVPPAGRHRLAGSLTGLTATRGHRGPARGRGRWSCWRSTPGSRSLPGGFVGVDVFFVISGFLITGHLLREVADAPGVCFARFYARRVGACCRPRVARPRGHARPALSSCLPSCCSSRRSARTIASAPVRLELALRRPRPPTTSPPPRTRPARPALLVAVGRGAVLPGVAARWWRSRVCRHAAGPGPPAPPPSRSSSGPSSLSFVAGVAHVLLPPWAFFWHVTRAWELGLGALLAVRRRAGRRAPARRGPLPPGSVSLPWCWADADLTPGRRVPGHRPPLPVLGTALVIAAAAPAPSVDPRGRAARLLGRPAALGGRYSYSLYLWHWPPLVLVPVVIGSPLSAGAGFVVVLLASVPAVLAYRYVAKQAVPALEQAPWTSLGKRGRWPRS